MPVTPLEIIDRKHLDSMTGGNRELAVEVIEIFQHQIEIWARMLDPKADTQQWTDAAHTLKGASLGIGALRLAKACETAEQLGRSETVSLMQAAIALGEVKDEIGAAQEMAAKVIYELTSSGTRCAS